MILRNLLEMWDWWIYYRARQSLRRLCQRQPGMVYLLMLWLQGWLDESALDEGVKRSAESFYQSLRDMSRPKS